MLERLIEGWLDSASERTYQTPFCQILIGQGHRIIHSTRHTPTEFGKDIISLHPSGKVCAFQLKGNPNSRINLTNFREIAPQILELINMAPPMPGLPSGQHEAFLVTNGVIDEDVYLAINQMNHQYSATGHPERQLQTITRGDLLDSYIKLGLSLWPTEISSIKLILEFLVEDGKNQLPLDKLHQLLMNTLRLDIDTPSFQRATELRRAITSAALLNALVIKNYSEEENHWAIMQAWIMFATYTMASCIRSGFSLKRNGLDTVNIAINQIMSSLIELCDEISTNEYLFGSFAQVEPFVYKPRYTLLIALMSILGLWCSETGWPSEDHKIFINEFIPKDMGKLIVWGEGAIPQFIFYIWYLKTVDPTPRSDAYLGSLLSSILECNIGKNDKNLASPYYSLEDRILHDLSKIDPTCPDPLHGDTFFNRSYFTEILMHLLGRTGLKQTAKRLWPNYTKVNFQEFIVGNDWEYCLYRAKKGSLHTRVIPREKNWNDLMDEANESDGKGIPKELKDKKFLLMLFLVMFPHRANGSALRYLGTKFHPPFFSS